MISNIKQELTAIQMEFVNAWLFNGESQTATAKALKLSGRGECSHYLALPKVRAEIARRKGELLHALSVNGSLAGITREMKAQLLWEVADAGRQPGFDREGNAILVNPASTIQAIRELNLMTGHHAPTVVEQTVTHVRRSEIEIKASIAELEAEAKSLIEAYGSGSSDVVLELTSDA